MEALLPVIEAAANAMTDAFTRGGRVIAFGNGGSAADAQHLAAELVGRARRERRPLPALALSADSSTVTALANDYGFADVFAREVRAHTRAGDVVVGISTSGASENVVRGLAAAQEVGATTIVLSGAAGGGPRSPSLAWPAEPSRAASRVQREGPGQFVERRST
jgi:D-sedoheptulose 7-phosphate isomerase